MNHFIVRMMVPQESWVAANDPKDAQVKAVALLQIHATGFVPAILHSVEPAPTNTPAVFDEPIFAKPPFLDS